MFAPMIIVIAATVYLSSLCIERIFDDSANGIPITPLIKVIPMMLPIPKMARK